MVSAGRFILAFLVAVGMAAVVWVVLVLASHFFDQVTVGALLVVGFITLTIYAMRRFKRQWS